MRDVKRGPDPTKGTYEAYLQALRQSGLMEEAALTKALSGFQSSSRTPETAGKEAAAQAPRTTGRDEPPSGSTLGRYLMAQNHITGWQHRMLLEGRFRGFFLGRYRLLRLLGSGGMSQVYLAEHMRMRRRVAIKVLSNKLTSEAGTLERFMSEARAIAALDHVNIVHAYNVDNDGGIYYLVMQYVEGHDLSRIVEVRGPLPFEKAADYIRQAADGLAHAHDRGLIHRDVKPHNLLVDRTGTVKITDLGLALQTNMDEASLTRAFGQGMLGTTDYLAPEQALDSHNVDARADIYSLGCTLYFLLTGRAPFNEGTLAQRLVKHQTAEPTKIVSLRKDAPPDLTAICAKMMAKQPVQRYQTARAVSATLAEWLATRRSGAATTADVPEAQLAEGSSQAISQVSVAPLIDDEDTTDSEATDLLVDSGDNLTGVPAGSASLPPLPPTEDTAPSRRLSVARLHAASDSIANRYTQRKRVQGWKNLAVALAVVTGLSTVAWFAVNQLSASRPAVTAGAEGAAKKNTAWIVLDWPVAERTGAKIAVDGVPFETPVEGVVEIPVDAGSRRLTITKPGSAPYERTIVVTEGQRKSIAPWFGGVAQAAPAGEVLLATRPATSVLALDRLDSARLSPAASAIAARAPLVALWGDLRFAHWTPIRSLTYTPNGALAAVSHDSHLKLWQPDGTAAWETVPPPAEFAYVTALDCSSDGKLACLETPLNGKSVIRVRSLTTGAIEQTLGIGAQPIAFTFVGDNVVAGNANGSVQLWNTMTGQPGPEIATTLAQIRLVAASSSGELLAVAGASVPAPAPPGTLRAPALKRTAAAGEVAVQNAAGDGAGAEKNADQKADVEANDPAVQSPAKPRVVPRQSPRAPVLVIDPASKEVKHTLEGHEGQVTALEFIPGGGLVASAGLDGAIRVWSAESGELAKEIEAHKGAVLALAADADGELLASLGAPDATLRIWDVATGQMLREATLATAGLSQPQLAFSPDSKTLSLTTGVECRVLSFAVDSLASSVQFAGHDSSVMSACWQPAGRLLTADMRGRVLSWNPAAGAGVPVGATEPGKPVATLLAPTADLLASVAAAAGDQMLHINVLTGGERAAVGPGMLVLASPASWAFSPDGLNLAASWYDLSTRRYALNVWDARTGAAITTQGAATSRVSALAWSPDGKLLAAAAQTGQKHDITLYDTTTWAAKSVCSGHIGLIYSLAFSSDSLRLASASLDGSVRLWKSPEGTQLAQLAHESPAMAVDISPDGTKLATLGRDGALKVWTVGPASLTLSATYPLFPGGSPAQFSFGPTACPVQRMLFAPDSRHLALTCSNGIVYVMRLGAR